MIAEEQRLVEVLRKRKNDYEVQKVYDLVDRLNNKLTQAEIVFNIPDGLKPYSNWCIIETFCGCRKAMRIDGIRSGICLIGGPNESFCFDKQTFEYYGKDRGYIVYKEEQ